MTPETQAEDLNEIKKRAMELFWSSDLQQADELLCKALESTKDIEISLLYAEVGWLRAILSECPVAEKESKRRFNLCTSGCNKNIFTHRAARAECTLLSSLLSLRMGNYISGAFYLRKGWLLCSELLGTPYSKDFDSAPLDIQQRLTFIVAAFHFFVSIIPPTIRFIVSALGFEADRKKGYEQIRECFKTDSSVRLIAGILTLWIETFFTENLPEAKNVFEECLSIYPNNMLILYLGGYLERQRFNVENAIGYFKSAARLSNDLRQFRIACDYELGDCYWKLMNWDKSIEYFVAFHTANKTKSFRCFGAYQLGVSYCFNDNETEARKWFIKSQKWSRKYFSFDFFAARKSKEYVNSSPMIDDVEKDFIRVSILRKQGKQQEGLEILDKYIINDVLNLESPEEKAYFYYIKGRLLKETGNMENALEQFDNCVKLNNVKNEIYTIPHSFMEKGDIYFRLGDKVKAKEELKQAKTYKSYDFDKPNIRRIMRLLDQLEDDDFIPSSEFSAND